MPDVTAEALHALIRDRYGVLGLGSPDRYRSADGPSVVGRVALPFDALVAGITFLGTAPAPAASTPASGTWRATVRVAGIDVASATIDLATLDPLAAVPVPFAGPSAVPKGAVIEVGLVPAVGSTPIDAPSFTIWYWPA